MHELENNYSLAQTVKQELKVDFNSPHNYISILKQD